MNLREDYGNENIDELLCYFMRTILRIQKNGVASIPLDVVFDEPIQSYLEIAIDLMTDAQPPELSDLILQVEYEQIRLCNQLTREQSTLLLLIKELSRHIWYDDDRADYLLSTCNIWNNKANEYATKTFYCNLPAETQKRQGFEQILKHIPVGFLAPDHF